MLRLPVPCSNHHSRGCAAKSTLRRPSRASSQRRRCAPTWTRRVRAQHRSHPSRRTHLQSGRASFGDAEVEGSATTFTHQRATPATPSLGRAALAAPRPLPTRPSSRRTLHLSPHLAALPLPHLAFLLVLLLFLLPSTRLAALPRLLRQEEANSAPRPSTRKLSRASLRRRSWSLAPIKRIGRATLLWVAGL